MSSMKHQSYSWTLNNPTDVEKMLIRKPHPNTYLIYGEEVGESGTPHLQGYIRFKNQRAWSAVKSIVGARAHIEVSKGSPQQNIAYCSKDNKIYEYGERPKQGFRADIKRINESVRNGCTIRDVLEQSPNVQCIRIAEINMVYFEPERDWKPEVRWYYGETGTGKTLGAREWLGEDIYTSLGTNKWWQGYDRHENVLIDDFRRDFCKYHELLRILDRYPYKVETKGGSRQFVPRKIAITCPYPPTEIYETREDLQQLLRRIDEIIHVEKKDNDNIHAT